MTMFQPVQTASDRVMAALIAGLEIEFGRVPSEGLAQHFLAAEDTDFRWDARISERWLGSYEGGEEDDPVLDRVAVCGRLDGTWFAATMLVDGDGEAHGMLGCRSFKLRALAEKAMTQARQATVRNSRDRMRTASRPGFLMPRLARGEVRRGEGGNGAGRRLRRGRA